MISKRISLLLVSCAVFSLGNARGFGQTFNNASFETPAVSGYTYTPAGSGWMFTNNAGIQRNGSAYSGTATVAPDGVQTALLQSASGTLGAMSQSVSFPAGTYTISFRAARRWNSIQPIRVSVDGVAVGTYSPSSNSFEQITTAGFSVAAGSHTVEFAGTDSSGDKTSFIDLMSITSTGGGGGQPPAAPTGLSATSGNAQVILNWTASSGASSYNIYRGTSPGGQSATPIATGITGASYTNTGLTNGTAYYYKVRAVNSSGTSADSNEVSATPASGGGGGSSAFVNGSFETPSITGYTYSSSGTSWTFTNNAGIQRNGSAYSGTSAVAPEGLQTAFLQSVGGTLGTISQSVTFTAGTYTIGFQAARRYGSIQPIRVSVDGTVVGTYTPSGGSFEQINTASFSVSAGSHTIQFAATDNVGDKTTFIDLVTIGGTGGGSAPAAPTGLGATAGNAQVSLNWSASSGATSYNVYRGTTSNGQSATPIATGVTTTSFTNTGLANGTAYYYKIRAVNSVGSSGDSNEASATPSAGGASGAFVNASFETPSITGYSYTPSGSSWIFTNNAGIQRNGSAYSGTSAVAPGGVQTAFLQSMNTTLGTMSQVVNFSAGTYSITFHAARRYGSLQPVRISVDGSIVGTYTPSSNNFEQITTASFNVSAGSHTIQFAATDSIGDKTTYIDLVAIGGGGGGGSPPAAPTGLSATAGNTQVSLSWTASTGATSYNVYRGTTANGQSATAIATGITTTNYANTGLTNGTTYYYKVKAVNASGASGNSNEAFATPVSAGGGGDIDLTGYTLRFTDEFNSLSVTTSSPKGAATWYYLPPYGSAGFYSASTWDINAFSVSNGILYNKAWIGTEPGTWGTYWYSGNLSSVDQTGAGFTQLYGYFEARVKMPDSGMGAWPAFWLVTTTGIPAVSPTKVKVEEIDIFEWYGLCNTPGAFQSLIQQASHNWNPDGSQNPTPHLYSPQTPMPGGAYPWQGFHIYGCKIDPQHITWYIDGVQTNQIQTPTDYLTSPFYIMIDYALGGGWPLDGMVNNSTMEVDWVRVYSLPGQ